MSKISELSDGGALQSTDYLIAVRSGGNVKVQANGAASFTTLTASGDVNFDSGTFFVDASADAVGIGTTSFNAANKLEVTGDINTTWASGASRFIGMRFGDGSLYEMGLLVKESPELQVYAKHAAGAPITFLTGATPDEAMRIDTSGNLLVGTTSLAAIDGTPTTTGIGLKSTGAQLYSVADGGNAVEFRINGTAGAIGSINCSGSATSYNTSSDARLKENIADAEDAGAKVDAIQVRQFDWKADGSHQDYGMIAQELLTVAPETVSGDPESDDMMGVDYSKLVPMLVKEIQSLRARVAQLEGA